MPTYRTQLGNALKDYLNASALYTATLEDLQSQLAFIEAKIRKNKRSENSATLQRVLQKANTSDFKAYVDGTLCRRPMTDLAKRLDDNVRLLSVLRNEMRGHVQKASAVYTYTKAMITRDRDTSVATTSEGGNDSPASTSSGDGTVQYDALMAANIADNLERELLLVEKITDAVNVLTSSEEISSYVTILRLNPYLASSVHAEVLSWHERPFE